MVTPTTGIKLGFWLQTYGIIDQGYYTSNEFMAYFIEPPYFAFVEFIIAEASEMQRTSNWFVSVATQASSLPNAEIAVMCAWNLTDEAEWTIFDTFVKRFTTISSLTIVGIDFEHMRIQTGAENWNAYTTTEKVALVQRAKDIVEGEGKAFNTNFPEIPHTNFPSQNDFEQTLNLKTMPDAYVGMSAGYYCNYYPFPDPNALPSDPTERVDMGWNREVVQTVIQYGVSNSRQYIVLCPGQMSNGTVTGVSGKTTVHLWDSPLFRQYVVDEMATYPEGTFVPSVSPTS
jgi:hypothetical protein